MNSSLHYTMYWPAFSVWHRNFIINWRTTTREVHGVKCRTHTLLHTYHPTCSTPPCSHVWCARAFTFWWIFVNLLENRLISVLLSYFCVHRAIHNRRSHQISRNHIIFKRNDKIEIPFNRKNNIRWRIVSEFSYHISPSVIRFIYTDAVI